MISSNLLDSFNQIKSNDRTQLFLLSHQLSLTQSVLAHQQEKACRQGLFLIVILLGFTEKIRMKKIRILITLCTKFLSEYFNSRAKNLKNFVKNIQFFARSLGARLFYCLSLTKRMTGEDRRYQAPIQRGKWGNSSHPYRGKMK